MTFLPYEGLKLSYFCFFILYQVCTRHLKYFIEHMGITILRHFKVEQFYIQPFCVKGV